MAGEYEADRRQEDALAGDIASAEEREAIL
jgi:hypothetical protein